MLQYFGMLLIYLLGSLILLTISKKFKPLEILAYSFLLGIGTQAFIMFLFSIPNVKLSLKSLFIVDLIIIVAITYFGKVYKLFSLKHIKQRIISYFDLNQINKYNLLWLVCFGMAAFIVFTISKKNLFWPTFATDSLSSFDVFAKGIAHEGKLLNSLILERRVGYGAAYPPLYSLSLAYALMLGFSSSKIIPTLFFISLSIGLYSTIKKITNIPTLAIFFTLIGIISPELIAQSAINITSVPQAIYASLSVITLMIWSKTKDWKYFYLSAVLMAFSCFIRSEGIIYLGAVSLFLLTNYIKTKTGLKQRIIYFLISIFPFLMWQIFLALNIEVMDKFLQVEILPYLNTDKEQIVKIWSLAFKVIKSKEYYGLTYPIFWIAIFLNTYTVIKKKDHFWIGGIILSVFFGYLILINQLTLRSDSIENIINYSGKRFFFGIIILSWYYLATNTIVIYLFHKLESLLRPLKKQIS